MNNRNIVFAERNRAEVVDGERPAAGAGEVIVRLARSVISGGTERAQLTGVPDRATCIASTLTDDRVTFPRQCGYSSSGVVEEVGEGVADLAVGDRVALSWGVHAQFVRVPAAQAYRIPDAVGFGVAALAHIATFPLAAIRKCRLEIGESALVMGQGILGQLAVKLLAAGGAAPVVAVDPDAAKRDRALALGADFAFDPGAPDFVSRVRAVTRNGDRMLIAGRSADCGPRVGIEVTGHGRALNTLLDVLAPMGRVALLGCSRQSDFTIDYYHKVHGRGVTLVGAHTMARPDVESSERHWTTRDDAQVVLRLAACGRLDLEGFVEETHSVADAPQVYSRLARGGAFPVVEFDWEA